jgi:hypothetical protein
VVEVEELLFRGHPEATRRSDFTRMKSGIELWDPFEQGLLGKRPKSTG